MKETKVRRIIRELEKTPMKYTELQYFIYNMDNVFHLRKDEKPSRGYYGIGIQSIINTGLIVYDKATKKYSAKPGSSLQEKFYTKDVMCGYSRIWKVKEAA